MNKSSYTNKEEQILIRITGNDRPGLTASVMEILASKDAKILDIGQADIHSTLSLGVLIRISEAASGQVMKELLFKATELGVNIGFEPVTDDEYENWVNLQGKNRFILTLIGRLFSSLGHPNFKIGWPYRSNHKVYVVPHPFQVSSPLPAWSEHECC